MLHASSGCGEWHGRSEGSGVGSGPTNSSGDGIGYGYVHGIHDGNGSGTLRNSVPAYALLSPGVAQLYLLREVLPCM